MVTPAVKREAVEHLKAHLGCRNGGRARLPGRTARWCAISRGYMFVDFIKVGMPLNVIFAVVAVLIIPVFFPF